MLRHLSSTRHISELRIRSCTICSCTIEIALNVAMKVEFFSRFYCVRDGIGLLVTYCSLQECLAERSGWHEAAVVTGHYEEEPDESGYIVQYVSDKVISR